MFTDASSTIAKRYKSTKCHKQRTEGECSVHRHPIEYYSALRKEILKYAIAPVYPEDSIRPISQSVIGEEIPDPAKMGYVEL